jgi:hypothetical protein
MISSANCAIIESHFESADRIGLDVVACKMVVGSIEIAVKIAAMLDKNINVGSENALRSDQKEKNKDNKIYIKYNLANDEYSQFHMSYLEQRRGLKYKFINSPIKGYLNIKNQLKEKTSIVSVGEEIRKNKVLKMTKMALPRGSDTVALIIINNAFTWLFVKAKFFIYRE